MYFNHAFRKSFLPVTSPGALPGDPVQIVPIVAGTTAALTAGQIGFYNAKTWTAMAAGTAAPFVIAQGSYFTSDKIGPVHGGYKESVKSKVINPKYISRLMTVAAASPLNQIKDICVCNLECGKTYRLRLDLKGSPTLRFLSHNLYRTLDVFTGCCTDDCSAQCTGAIVDPTIATIGWAKQIATNPWLPGFILPTVNDWDGNEVAALASNSEVDVAAFIADLDAYSSATSGWDEYLVDNPTGAAEVQSCLQLAVAYEETKFGNCTFTPTDFYELQPLKIIASLVDETGDPCYLQCVSITGTWTNGVYTPDVQEPAQASGVGETILRELILDGRYLQNAFPDSSRVESLRMREIEADPALATVNRNGLYDQVMVLHSVPRFNNPTGTFDNDQYLLKIHVPVGTNISALTTFILAAATAAGNTDLAVEPY